MSFFSDINGFDTNKVKKEYQKINEHQDDYSEVDFCVNDNNISFTQKDDNNLVEEYMYNYDITEEEAKEYIAKSIDTEG